MDRSAARRLWRLRFDAIDHPGAEGVIAYTKANKRTAEGGEIRLYVNDKEEAKLPFAAGATEA